MKLDQKAGEAIKQLYREGMADGRIVTYKGAKYEVKGDKRLQVVPLSKPKKAGKAKSGEPAQDESVKCAECGELFLRSRFTPYFTKCLKHRKGEGKTVKVECEKCHKSFERSVYMPYLKQCTDCRTPRKAPAPKKKAKAA